MAYNPNFKKPALDYGRLIEPVTHSHDERIHAEFAPASWLPLGVTATNATMGFFSHEIFNQNQITKRYMVLLPGKLVGLTRENKAVTEFGEDLQSGNRGRIVPAGVRINWRAASGGTDILEYTSLDVEERIMDLTTGEPVVAPVAYDKDTVTAALRGRGLLGAEEELHEFVSRPVGFMETAVYAWCGGDGIQPRGFRHHNYKVQGEVPVIQDGHALRLPQVPLADATVTVPVIGTVASDIVETEGGSPLWVTSAGGELSGLDLTLRYGSDLTGVDFVGLVLGTRSIEHSFITPLKITRGGADVTSAVLKSRKESIAQLSKAGDYYVDLDMGILFMYEDGGDAIPTGMAAGDVVTFFRNTASDTTQETLFASVKGDVVPGDFLVCDGQSNFRKYVPAPDLILSTETVFVAGGSGDPADIEVSVLVSPGPIDQSLYDRPEDIVGQVVYMFRSPVKDVAMVHTYHDNRLASGIRDRMAGSATEGFTTRQTYALGGQFEVVVNFIGR